jgi:hypothetical protein
MIKINLQFFGGRGATSGSGGEGGGNTGGNIEVANTTSLVSMRNGDDEEARALADETLAVFKEVNDEYGTQVADILIAELGKGSHTMAYYDAGDNIAINQKYFNSKTMNQAYADCVKSGFHPSNGNKTALQAVVAHELGHALTERVGAKMGKAGFFNIDKTANTIVRGAMWSTEHKTAASFRSAISGYAKRNNAECIAEAFSDVFCNGTKAKKESRAVVKVINDYLK